MRHRERNRKVQRQRKTDRSKWKGGAIERQRYRYTKDSHIETKREREGHRLCGTEKEIGRGSGTRLRY
jgi:hypothetical protein